MSNGTVNILGAGLCGSLLAIMLARRGQEVVLWERQADPRLSKTVAGRSINLALAARGIRALQHAEVFAPVKELLVPMRGRMIHHPDGATELQPYGSREHEQIYSVSRAELNRILLNCAEQEHGVTVNFGYSAKAFKPAKHELWLERSSDGTTHSLSSGPLIAADGAGSVVRRAYNGDSTIVPGEELLPHGYKELTLPAAADGGFRLDPGALHIWPRGGFMLIALPNPGGDFTLTLFMAKSGDVSFESLQSVSDITAFFEEHFADILPQLPKLQAEFANNPVGILGTVRCQRWNDGELLLIGDAAHAIVPFHGQGMNLAFEDCALLDLHVQNSNGDWSAAFAVFAAEQQPNAEAIADMALDNYVEMRDRVRDPKFVLHKQLAFEFERRMPGRFIPRYSMVMFHPEIPYAVAQQRGAMQQRLLQEITAGVNSVDEVDLSAAEEKIRSALPALDERQVSQ